MTIIQDLPRDKTFGSSEANSDDHPIFDHDRIASTIFIIIRSRSNQIGTASDGSHGRGHVRQGIPSSWMSPRGRED